MTSPALVYPNGTPVTKQDTARIRMRASASAPYQASDVRHQDLSAWTPGLTSGQAALSFDRDMIAARIHDIARNDGWASAAISRLVDNVIGAGWRLSAKPNARSLGIDPEQAEELADNIETAWEDYANDPGKFCDVGRRSSLGQVLALAFRHWSLDGESLGVLYWLPDRGGEYATAMQVIDPDRLSMPMGRIETETFRAGVEMDEHGAALAYHIRAVHPGDFIASTSALAFQWERVETETEWGRPVIAHAFEVQRAGMVRGVPPMSPILKKLKQITRYDEAELQAAVINATMAAFITSPFDHDQLAESLSGGADDDSVGAYQDGRLGYYKDKPLRMDGAQVSFLYPGEEVKFNQPAHPNPVFDAFERAGLRNIASAVGLSYEQLTMDWSQVNYSSARAALLEVHRGFTARKGGFASGFMQPWYVAWLEEAIDRGKVKLPKGAPPFAEKRPAYCRAEWIGPGRGWVDPLKEANAAATRLDAGLSTYERECAEQGLDWKAVAEQRARERRHLQGLGLNPDAALRGGPSSYIEPEERAKGSA